MRWYSSEALTVIGELMAAQKIRRFAVVFIRRFVNEKVRAVDALHELSLRALYRDTYPAQGRIDENIQR